MTSRMTFKPAMVSMLVASWLAWCFAYGSDAANARPPCKYSTRTSLTMCPFFGQAKTNTYDYISWRDCSSKCDGVSGSEFCWGIMLEFVGDEVEEYTLYMLDSSSPPPSCAHEQQRIEWGRYYSFCEPIAVSSTTTTSSTTSTTTTPSPPTTSTTGPTQTAETTRTTETTTETTRTTSTAFELSTQTATTTKELGQTSQKTLKGMPSGTNLTTPSTKGSAFSAITTAVDGTSYVPVNQSTTTGEVESAVGSSTTVAENSTTKESDNNTTFNNTNITRKTTHKQMIATVRVETKSSFDNVNPTFKPTLISDIVSSAKFIKTTPNVTENVAYATSSKTSYIHSGQDTTPGTTKTTMDDERNTLNVHEKTIPPPSDSATSLHHPQSTNSPNKLGFPLRLRTCVCRRNVSLQVPEDPDVIKKDLILDVKTLSSSRRRKESSSDPRPSTVQIGSVWMIIILIPLGLIVLSDLPYMYRNARYRKFSSAQPSTPA